MLLHTVPGPVLRLLQKNEKIETTQDLKSRELVTGVREESRGKPGSEVTQRSATTGSHCHP